jgi:hypothetical protein
MDHIINHYEELKFAIKVVTFIPERPAPPCQDHDNPKYSDSGDDEVIEIEVYLINEGTREKFLIDNIFPDFLVSKIYDKCRQVVHDYF